MGRRPPPAPRAVGGRELLCFRTKAPPSRGDDTQRPLLHGGTAGLPGMQYIAATFSSMLRLSGCPSKLHDGVALGAAEQLDRLEQLQ